MQGLFAFCLFFGAGTGGFLSKYISSNYSRKEGGLICAYVVIVATLLLQSKNIVVLLVCRTVQGLYVGVTTVIRPVFIK